MPCTEIPVQSRISRQSSLIGILETRPYMYFYSRKREGISNSSKHAQPQTPHTDPSHGPSHGPFTRTPHTGPSHGPLTRTPSHGPPHKRQLDNQSKKQDRCARTRNEASSSKLHNPRSHSAGTKKLYSSASCHFTRRGVTCMMTRRLSQQ